MQKSELRTVLLHESKMWFKGEQGQSTNAFYPGWLAAKQTMDDYGVYCHPAENGNVLSWGALLVREVIS